MCKAQEFHGEYLHLSWNCKQCAAALFILAFCCSFNCYNYQIHSCNSPVQQTNAPKCTKFKAATVSHCLLCLKLALLLFSAIALKIPGVIKLHSADICSICPWQIYIRSESIPASAHNVDNVLLLCNFCIPHILRYLRNGLILCIAML